MIDYELEKKRNRSCAALENEKETLEGEGSDSVKTVPGVVVSLCNTFSTWQLFT